MYLLKTQLVRLFFPGILWFPLNAHGTIMHVFTSISVHAHTHEHAPSLFPYINVSSHKSLKSILCSFFKPQVVPVILLTLPLILINLSKTFVSLRYF